MACERNRGHYFAAVAGDGSPSATAFGSGAAAQAALEELFELGRNGPRPLAEQGLAEAQTRIMFAQMQRANIRPPTHSARGLPKADAQFGYALVQRTLTALSRQEPLPPQAAALLRSRERQRQLRGVQVDAGGRLRCQGCGRWASPVRGHVCPRTATAAALRRSLVRRLGVPPETYPEEALAELLTAAQQGDIALTHPATGELVTATLDALPMALASGFVPEGWGATLRTITPEGRVLAVPMGTAEDAAAAPAPEMRSALDPALMGLDAQLRTRRATAAGGLAADAPPAGMAALAAAHERLQAAMRDYDAVASAAADFGLALDADTPIIGAGTVLEPRALSAAEAAWLNRLTGTRSWRAGDTPHPAALAMLGDRAAEMEDGTALPPLPIVPPAPSTARAQSLAYGADPSQAYPVRYRVVDLDDLIPSNLDSGAINPAYDPALQPRQRDRAASQAQIAKVAQTLTPDALLTDFKQLDKGTPIIGGDDMCVESGNGRVLALRKARESFPAQWESYQAQLRAVAGDFGIDGATLAGMRAPVLVRERGPVADRAAFAREANAPPVLQMSTLENARVDAQRLTDATLLRLQVREDQSIDLALRATANRGFVRDFMETLPANERATLMRADGTLSQQGIWRIKAALFTRVFPGAAGGRLAETFTEALDSTTRNFESAVAGTLPALVRAQSRIRSGQRSADLDLSADMAASLDMLARLREQEMPVHVYLEQSTMFDRELTPLQEDMLRHFDKIGRTPKAIRGFLGSYAQAIEDAPDPSQGDMFGGAGVTKAQFFARLVAPAEAAVPVAMWN